MTLIKLLLSFLLILAAGCATTTRLPENCEIRHKGVCYTGQRAACKAARCPPERCLILDSYPGQVECSQTAKPSPPR
jgi:hypothetical protein